MPVRLGSAPPEHPNLSADGRAGSGNEPSNRRDPKS
jgi:hypothetical protein